MSFSVYDTVLGLPVLVRSVLGLQRTGQPIANRSTKHSANGQVSKKLHRFSYYHGYSFKTPPLKVQIRQIFSGGSYFFQNWQKFSAGGLIFFRNLRIFCPIWGSQNHRFCRFPLVNDLKNPKIFPELRAGDLIIFEILQMFGGRSYFFQISDIFFAGRSYRGGGF